MSTASLLKLIGDLQTQFGDDIRNVWSQRTLLYESYLPRDDAEGIADRITDIVALPGIRSECIRLAHRGSAVPTLDYVTAGRVGAWTVPDLIDHTRLNTIITERSATLLVDGLHLYDHDFHTLRSALDEHFDSHVEVSAFLTPRWSKGLSIHIDDEDVIVVQLKGTKDWNIHQPVDFDFRHGRGIEQAELTRKERSVRLHPGDLLYIPRGAPHVAATGSEGSVHFTIAIERPTISSLVATSRFDSAVSGEVGYGRAAHNKLLETTTSLAPGPNLVLTDAIHEGCAPTSTTVAQSLRALTGPLEEKTQFEAAAGFTLSDSDDSSTVVAVGNTHVSVPRGHARPLRVLAAGKRVEASSISDAEAVYVDQLIRLGLVNVVTYTL